jgi:apolipoprotein N-acyltransferase
MAEIVALEASTFLLVVVFASNHFWIQPTSQKCLWLVKTITGNILLTEWLDNWMGIQGMYWEGLRSGFIEMQTGLIHTTLFFGLIIAIHHDH